MGRSDLAHLIKQFSKGLTIVPEVPLPGLDVNVVEVDLDLLAERNGLDVCIVFIIEIEVKPREVRAQISERSCVRIEAPQGAVH